MVDKTKYIKKFEKLYKDKNGVTLPGDLSAEYFENLVCFVGAITNHIRPEEVIIPQGHEGREL